MVDKAKKGMRKKTKMSDRGWRLVAGFTIVVAVVVAELVVLVVGSSVGEIEDSFAVFQGL